MPDQFSVAVMQSAVTVVRTQEDKDRVIRENLRRDAELLDYLAEDPLYAPRLAVFPEFFLTGVPEGMDGRKGQEAA